MNRMGACFDRLRCEVFQNLFLSPMNTGFLGSAVATVLTVYGIETLPMYDLILELSNMLQQYLPFTVLKPITVLIKLICAMLQQYLPFTVLKLIFCEVVNNFTSRLQQYLPFTVLKPKTEL